MSSRICAVFQVIFRSLKYILVDTITTRYRVLYCSLSSRLHDTFTTSHIVKEQPIHAANCVVVLAKPNESTQCHASKRFHLATNPRSWWRMTGSNRRPPACKAGALPAELIPRRKSAITGAILCRSAACIASAMRRNLASRLAWFLRISADSSLAPH